MNRASSWMVAYGLFLVAGALVAISISGWDRSKTALMSSGGAAFLMIGCATLASRPKTESLGRWLGLGCALMFAATFFWRLTLNWAKPTEAAWRAANPGVEFQTALVQSPLQNWLFPTFIAGSLLTALLLALAAKGSTSSRRL